MTFSESPLDALLLALFRRFVAEGTGYDNTREAPRGILGLLAQGREYMLRPGVDADAQHEMVRETLRKLVTPALPPFYRWFMGGVVPAQSPPRGAARAARPLTTRARPRCSRRARHSSGRRRGRPSHERVARSRLAFVGPAHRLRNDGASAGCASRSASSRRSRAALCPLSASRRPSHSSQPSCVPPRSRPTLRRECQWSWAKRRCRPMRTRAAARLPRRVPQSREPREAGGAGGGYSIRMTAPPTGAAPASGLRGGLFSHSAALYL